MYEDESVWWELRYVLDLYLDKRELKVAKEVKARLLKSPCLARANTLCWAPCVEVRKRCGRRCLIVANAALAS